MMLLSGILLKTPSTKIIVLSRPPHIRMLSSYTVRLLTLQSSITYFPIGTDLRFYGCLRDKEPSLPAIIITGHSNENLVINAIRKHVADYIKKPMNLSYLKKRLSEIFSNEHDREGVETSLNKDHLLDAVAKHINKTYMNELTLDQIAHMACMNRFSFCRAFKERFGRTFTSYLNNIRIKHAVMLLKTSDNSITEIAFSVGYRNLGHFNRIFKAVFKMPPREYRRKIIYGRQYGILQAEEMLSEESPVN